MYDKTNKMTCAPEVAKLFFMLISTKHEIYHAHNVKIPTIVAEISCSVQLSMKKFNNLGASIPSRLRLSVQSQSLPPSYERSHKSLAISIGLN